MVIIRRTVSVYLALVTEMRLNLLGTPRADVRKLVPLERSTVQFAVVSDYSAGAVSRTIFQAQREGGTGREKGPEIRTIFDLVVSALLARNKSASSGDGIVHSLPILPLQLILELGLPVPKCPGPALSMINGYIGIQMCLSKASSN